jgi:two-component system, chemotaxis family, CheB/CheR fusion protein
MSDADDAAFAALLEFLKRTRGLDLTGYKRTSLERRFRRRMETVGCASFADYLDHLEVEPDEYARLFDTLLINVTEFFRDPPAWQHLREHVLPGLLATKAADEPVRVWSAGCATGQEPYTLAMVLAEALGERDYAERVKIYATDIDEDALAKARHGLYTAKEAESVPPDLRERYFEPADRRLVFRKHLRRAVIFGRNNLVADAPISRLDLVVCRNTLMYFTAETQARVLRHFHFALRDRGVLMLGRSEMMLSHRELFAAVDLRQRIFAKQPHDSLHARAASFAGREPSEAGAGPTDRETRDAALDVGPHTQVIVSTAGTLSFANQPARTLFDLTREDFGRPFADLRLSRRPVELMEPIEQALTEQRAVSLGDVELKDEMGETRRVTVTVAPLLSAADAPVGASVTFEDTTRYALLERELEANRRDLEVAYEELQSTIDELETTNEELQSANEELQTTNEELQSTNEELETMNEELQSTNEELETINDELRDRTGELNEINDFLEAILTSLSVGVAVLDADSRVQIWNNRAEDLWGMRRDEALDRHFLALDIGLPSEDLAAPLRAVLGGQSERETRDLEAVNRRGRSIVCAATVLPLVSAAPGPGTAVRGAIVLMEDRRADGNGSG